MVRGDTLQIKIKIAYPVIGTKDVVIINLESGFNCLYNSKRYGYTAILEMQMIYIL